MRYLISPEPHKAFPSSCDSMDLNGAGSNLTEEPRTAGKAGWGGPNGPTPSRLIYTNFSNTPDPSLIQRAIMNRTLLHPAFKDSRLKQLNRYPQLHEYYDTTRDFLIFLHDTGLINISIKGLVEKDGDIDAVTINRPYGHRWSKPYADGRIARATLWKIT